MKKVFLLFVMLMINTITTAQDFNVVGKWKATDTDGGDIFLVFDSKGFISLSNGVETYGGEAVDMGNDVIVDFTYEINMERKPFSLDFVMYNSEDRSNFDRKRGYFKIINENMIELKNEVFSEVGARYEDLYKYTFKREI